MSQNNWSHPNFIFKFSNNFLFIWVTKLSYKNFLTVLLQSHRKNDLSTDPIAICHWNSQQYFQKKINVIYQTKCSFNPISFIKSALKLSNFRIKKFHVDKTINTILLLPVLNSVNVLTLPSKTIIGAFL